MREYCAYYMHCSVEVAIGPAWFYTLVTVRLRIDARCYRHACDSVPRVAKSGDFEMRESNDWSMASIGTILDLKTKHRDRHMCEYFISIVFIVLMESRRQPSQLVPTLQSPFLGLQLDCFIGHAFENVPYVATERDSSELQHRSKAGSTPWYWVIAAVRYFKPGRVHGDTPCASAFVFKQSVRRTI